MIESNILLPNKHPQRDFFIADIVDASLKDDLASMEHPIFALQAGDTKERVYENKGIKIRISPTAAGIATIFDKDIWIYCISQLVEATNRGREISRTVRFTAYDFLVTTNRDTSGRAYQRMTEALERLSGTRIITNLETAGKKERAGFGLVDSWRVIERNFDNRMVAIEVTLPDWLYRSILSKNVLSLNPDYFRVRKALHRRIYETARKHCGTQVQWVITLELLYKKSGSRDSIYKFRSEIKVLAQSNKLPDYSVEYLAEQDQVIFKRWDNQ